MPRVLGIAVQDEGMAFIAKRLMQAHLVVVCLGLLYGILQCIEYFTLQAAVESVQGATGTSKEQRVAGGAIVVFFNIALPLACPVAVFFLVRASIIQNNKGLLQGICFLDGCCVCCFGCGIVSGIMFYVNLLAMQQAYQGGTCEDGAYVDSSGTRYQTRLSQAECEQKKAVFIKKLPILMAFGIIGIILGIIQMCVCLVSTVKANDAQAALIQEKVFCGPPRVPAAFAQVGGQPGVVMVVGQPIGAADIPMGHPVSPVPASPSSNAVVVQAKTVQS